MSLFYTVLIALGETLFWAWVFFRLKYIRDHKQF